MLLWGRLIVDESLVTNDHCGRNKKKRKKCMVFKANFEEAYAWSMNWNFVDYMMERIEFYMKWRDWVMECVHRSQSQC